MCRWRRNPYSTQQTVASHKLRVISRAAGLFALSDWQAENMANRAGLSCSQKPVEADLAQLLRGCTRSQRALLYQTAVSERMLQYYLAGRRPSKQALLAVLILLEQAADEPVLQAALRAQGYCLSESLANDAVVRWFLFAQPRPVLTLELLGNINAVLYELGLPLLISGHGKSYT